MLHKVPEHVYNDDFLRKRPARISNTPGPDTFGPVTSWLVVPFHPALYRQGLSGIASKMAEVGIDARHDVFKHVRIAWSRGYDNLEQRTSRLFKKVFGA